MARRPPDVDRRQWLEERARIWRRRNRVLTALMLVTIAAVVVRNCA